VRLLECADLSALCYRNEKAAIPTGRERTPKSSRFGLRVAHVRFSRALWAADFENPKGILFLMKNLFSKTRVVIALSVVAMFVTATAFARAGKQDFVLHNETGVEIHELYVSPVTTDDWEDDVLGVDTLPDGDSVKVVFDDRDKHAHWDLKVVDSKGNSIEWNDLNLVEISEVTLHYKDGKAWADVK